VRAAGEAGAFSLAAAARGDEAEACFLQSLELSRREAAPARELRTAIDLAGPLAAQGRPQAARGVLQSAFGKFADGSDTEDLKTTRRLSATLS
jgi:hypothetical protein